ncbi:hypothetical protein HDC90_001130 [Pedobacter sp. AK013]|nr:hypothetical protein [Pedobacter sp. AK013]
MKDTDILANIVKVNNTENIDLNVICPECGQIHYTFINTESLTTG